MIQDTLAGPEWADALNNANHRALTLLSHTDMTPYGDITLHMGQRIVVSALASPETAAEETCPKATVDRQHVTQRYMSPGGAVLTNTPSRS